jgi:hypothetical protein
MPTAPPEGRMLYDTAANAPLKKKRPSRQPEGKLVSTQSTSKLSEAVSIFFFFFFFKFKRRLFHQWL